MNCKRRCDAQKRERLRNQGERARLSVIDCVLRLRHDGNQVCQLILAARLRRSTRVQNATITRRHLSAAVNHRQLPPNLLFSTWIICSWFARCRKFRLPCVYISYAAHNMNMANNLERVSSWSFFFWEALRFQASGHTVHTFCLGCTHIIMFAAEFALKSLAASCCRQAEIEVPSFRRMSPAC